MLGRKWAERIAELDRKVRRTEALLRFAIFHNDAFVSAKNYLGKGSFIILNKSYSAINRFANLLVALSDSRLIEISSLDEEKFREISWYGKNCYVLADTERLEKNYQLETFAKIIKSGVYNGAERSYKLSDCNYIFYAKSAETIRPEFSDFARKISFDFSAFSDANYLWWLPASPYESEIEWLEKNMPNEDYVYGFEQETFEEEQNELYGDEEDAE